MRVNPLTLSFYGQLEEEFAEDYFQKSILHIRIALVVGIAIYGAFGAIDIWLVPEARSGIWFWRFLVCLLAIAVLSFSFAPKFKQLLQTSLSLILLVSGLNLVALTATSHPLVRDNYHAGLIILIAFSYTFVKLRFIYATLVGWLISMVMLAVDIWVLRFPSTILVNCIGLLLSANIIGMFACYSTELYMRKDFLHDRQLIKERDKSSQLLLNILPQSIVDKLENRLDRGLAIADSFAEVTVLFADIVNFTQFSERVPPTELVRCLNQIFSAFDLLAEKHGLEKIKTIGDAYMVVGGLPIPREDHAEAIAEMALEMLAIIEHLNTSEVEDFSIRIGINTGPVIAGVIGVRKFIYDLWGDTVNTASRMESHSLPGCIQITDTTYQRLQNKYLFENRGEIEVKGKGKMTTYFLKAKNTSSRS